MQPSRGTQELAPASTRMTWGEKSLLSGGSRTPPGWSCITKGDEAGWAAINNEEDAFGMDENKETRNTQVGFIDLREPGGASVHKGR